MARALGMNPKKLPRLRPGPNQRWKLPVGAFIEKCYGKRFSGDSHGHAQAEQGPHQPAGSTASADAAQVSDLVCYFMNLADDLEILLSKGTIAAAVLPAIAKELRAIADALESGTSISPFPEITLPSDSVCRASRSSDEEGTCDDEIPF